MTQGQPQRDSAGSARRGGLVDLVAVPSTAEGSGGIPLEAWLKLAVLGGMLIAVNYRQFPIILRKWIDDPNWSHGFLIPLFSAFLIYTRWGELTTVRRRTWLWGLPVLLVAVMLEVAAYNDGNPWACQIGMLLVAFGLVLYLGGPGLTKLLWLPIFYLVFALPFPDAYYGQLALPLQNAAASASEAILNLLGYDVLASHSTLWVRNVVTGVRQPLSVEEACSGMRLLMAFVALSVFMAYLTDRALWQRVVLVAAGVPIAILCNVIRVSITCYMFIIDHQEFGKDFMHTFAGMVMLAPAFGLLWGLGWLLNRLFVDVPDDEADDETAETADGS